MGWLTQTFIYVSYVLHTMIELIATEIVLYAFLTAALLKLEKGQWPVIE